MRCDVCGREVREEELYGFYPEDSTYICKTCFSQISDSPGSNPEQPGPAEE